MKIKALSNVVTERSESKVFVEMKGGEKVIVTGFVVIKDKKGNDVILLKAGVSTL